MNSTAPEIGRQYPPGYLKALEAKSRRLETDQRSSMNERLMVMSCAAGLGIAFDTFFNGQRFGISVLLFALLLTAAVHLTFKGVKQVFLSGFLLAATLLLCLTYALFNNVALQFLNGLAIPLAFTGYVLAARYGAWQALDFSCIGILASKLVPQSLGAAPKLFAFFTRDIAARPAEGASATRRQILQGLLLAAPLLVVVLLLLTHSDAVFSRLITDRFAFFHWEMNEVVGHLLLASLATLYFFGYLWSLKYDAPENGAPYTAVRNLETVTALTVMGLLCLVYLLFTLVQFAYLYSAAAALPEGLTYADYARRGFFELLAAALVNVAAILAVSAKTASRGQGLDTGLKLCNALMTLFTLNLLASAFYRMHLYESAYGFTELRLFVQFFMGFMAISLGALLLWIWKRELPLFKIVLITAITAYVALNYVNVDRLIAHNNLVRYQLTHEIDIRHLSWLSVDAWPEIAAAQLPPGVKKQLADAFLMNQYPFADQHDRWFEYNISMARFLEMQPVQPPVMRERYMD
jgi:hypothetical protein